MSAVHDLEFVYEPKDLAGITIVARAFNEPLNQFLAKVLSKHDLKFYQDTTGKIHIVPDVEPVREDLYQAKRYDGPPTRRKLTVSGRVTDEATGESLPFVNVYVQGTQQGTESNVDGYFTLLNVPTDTHTLVLSYIGYNDQLLHLNPEAPLSELTVGMVTSSTQLGEVVVTAEREELLQATGGVGKLKMTPAKLAALPSLGERDIFRSFQLMPGISAANEHTSGLYVRGGTPDQALTLYDGFTVYNVDHLFGFFSAFNANAIKDVQLYKGTFDAKYGGRLSSVVEITGKEGNNRKFTMGGDVSLLSVNLFAEVPLSDKLTTIATFRRSWKSPIYNEIFDRFSGAGDDDNPLAERFGSNIASYFYDLNFKTTWRPTTKDVFSLSVYNGQDDLDNSIKPELPAFFADQDLGIEINDVTKWGNTGTSLKWSRRWNERLYTNTLASYSSYFSDRDRSVDGSITNSAGETQDIRRGTLENSDLLDYSFRTDLEWKASPNQQVEVGAFFTYNDIAYTYSQNDTSSIIDRRTDGSTYGAYLQDKLTLLDNRLTLKGGLRATYFTETAQTYFEPRFDFSLQITPLLTLKGAAGRYYQFAKRVIREDVLQGSRDFWVLSDDDRLPVSKNDQVVLGFSYETQNWLFDVEAYHKELDGLSEYSLRFTPTVGNVDFSESFFVGTGTARGIDFLLQRKYGRWNGWIGYTLADVRNNFDVFSENDFYAANDVTHEFKLVNLYKLGQWDLSLTWIYASDRPYTAPESGYELELLDGSTASYLNVGPKNGARLPDYHRLDAAATYNFKNSDTTLGFSVFNLYNRINTWYRTFEIIEDQILTTDVNYLGITPNVTLSMKF